MYEIQIRQHTDGIAGNGRKGRAVYIDLRNGDQRIVQDDLDAHACQQSCHGHPLLFQSLQDPAGSLHHRKQNNGHSAQAKHMAGFDQIGF